MLSSVCADDNRHRHLAHKVMNLTHHGLVLVLDHHESGRWSLPPAEFVPAQDAASFCSCNRNGEMTGTAGAYCYRLRAPVRGELVDFFIVFLYSNPLVGSFKAGIKVYRGDEPTHERLRLDYQSVTSNRTEVLFGTDDSDEGYLAVSIPGSRVVFEVRETHGSPFVTPVSTPLFDTMPFLPHVCRLTGASFGSGPRKLGGSGRGASARKAKLSAGPFYPNVAPYRPGSLYHLKLAYVNLDVIPPKDRPKIDAMDAIAQLLASFNVVCVQNVHKAGITKAVAAAASRGVTAVHDRDMLVLSEYPILDHEFVPFRIIDKNVSPYAPGFLFVKILLPQGGAATFILTRLHSVVPFRARPPTNLSSPLHYEAASVRFSQFLDIMAYIRRRPTMLEDGLFLMGDLAVTPPEPPEIAPDLLMKPAPSEQEPFASLPDEPDIPPFCPCRNTSDGDGSFRTLLNLAWRSTGAQLALDLFHDASMDAPLSHFMDMVAAVAKDQPPAPDTVAGRDRVMFLAAPTELVHIGANFARRSSHLIAPPPEMLLDPPAPLPPVDTTKFHIDLTVTPPAPSDDAERAVSPAASTDSGYVEGTLLSAPASPMSPRITMPAPPPLPPRARSRSRSRVRAEDTDEPAKVLRQLEIGLERRVVDVPMVQGKRTVHVAIEFQAVGVQDHSAEYRKRMLRRLG
ncbi:hypothetical protein AMAG_02998 [Allomyces macrogynus ATCC 38327]|uniref:Uncharacterized protein n=1 Tax=Allomyces macrogynus (strain ATCC 38327) TaxID=578462 RepID=A0A0L0S492_ALLM3|nr:hypothetical protein AMAG_02998 [Allomyces macrogynus ATCC 38327]|eukprot:KNE57265.1 hypothetical protein AMAG_02998 [Allomyces macrogynus ATCC 38327]